MKYIDQSKGIPEPLTAKSEQSSLGETATQGLVKGTELC